MKQGKPLLPRGKTRANQILKQFPKPVPYARRHEPGSYSLSGAYLMCRGLRGEDETDETVRFPQANELSEQLAKDNSVLRQPARGLVALVEDNPGVTLADLFAEAIHFVEDEDNRERAARLLDLALFLSKADAARNGPPLQAIVRVLKRKAAAEVD